MYQIKPLSKLYGEIKIPPDKSISHRAVLIAALSDSAIRIKPFLESDDTNATLDCISRLGIKAEFLEDQSVYIQGRGLYFPRTKCVSLNTHESGTTMRIVSGILCGQRFSSVMRGAPGLCKRPMKRITMPLRMMGADIWGTKTTTEEEYPPLKIYPVKQLESIRYKLVIPSAQIKSAILLASLYTMGITEISESLPSRDHTERMLSFFNAKIKKNKKKIIFSSSRLIPQSDCIFIPSDFSSAAFFIVLGLIVPDSEILIKDVNLNPTRCGLLNVLRRMHANIQIIKKNNYYEPYGDILVKSSSLIATKVKESEIPLMIDEIPILTVAAAFAKGETIIKGVNELKVKETDRINSMVYNLLHAGIAISAQQYHRNQKKDWLIKIQGRTSFTRAQFKAFGDHRTAMSMIVFGMATDQISVIDDVTCINKSFPEFIKHMKSFY